MRIVVLDGYTLNPGDLSWDGIKQLGDCTIYDRTPPEKTVERAKGAEAVFTNKVVFNREVLQNLPELKFIGVLATGYNVVDLDAATEAGIVVANIPAYSTASVAQMVFSHILHIVQNVSKHAESVKNGEWANSIDFSYHLSPQTELAGKTLGIIGFGQIGQAVAKIGLALGMNILFNNRSKKETDLHARQVDLDTLLEESDFISINCPLTAENEGFINKAAISKMKTSAILINTGRGPLINENDLAEALNNGRIAAAGLDVLSTEPPAPDNPLLSAKNCYITPHIAWATTEARERLMKIATENLEAFLKGKPQNKVN
ncbi:MAG: D-2-hydroxyacid dehydrogenase [Mariniphaga sp.]|jgi:glycerate dehydrogenase|nr:D-2-hydroxyacid dehydrogenase [Mariniphaga sp.]